MKNPPPRPDEHQRSTETKLEPRSYRSLADIAGQWQEDPEFDRALEAQRQIDLDMWR